MIGERERIRARLEREARLATDREHRELIMQALTGKWPVYYQEPLFEEHYDQPTTLSPEKLARQQRINARLDRWHWVVIGAWHASWRYILPRVVPLGLTIYWGATYATPKAEWQAFVLSMAWLYMLGRILWPRRRHRCVTCKSWED